MRVKIEEMDLNEVYRDYKSLKELTEKYYYYTNEKLREASEALLKTLLAEASKRTIDELETNYNDNLIAESVKQINKDGENSPYNFKTTEVLCDIVTAPQCGDWEVKVEAKANEEEEHTVPLIKQRDIVYTTDGGKTFKNCNPHMWKYDMGIPVGYVIEVDDTQENNVTICADRVFHNITLYGLNIKSIVDDYVFSTTIFEASNNYDGEKNTELLYESLSDKDTHCALSTIKNYKIEGVDKDAIKWYIPSCGELKSVSSAFAYWMERKFDLKPYISFWTSNISTKDSGWIFSVNSCKPNLTQNMNWEQTLLPFAKVKVVQD